MQKSYSKNIISSLEYIILQSAIEEENREKMLSHPLFSLGLSPKTFYINKSKNKTKKLKSNDLLNNIISNQQSSGQQNNHNLVTVSIFLNFFIFNINYNLLTSN